MWIQSIPSPRLVASPRAEEPSPSYYLPIAGERLIGFIPFPRVLGLCEMQSVSSRILTSVAASISYDDNHYITGHCLSFLIVIFQVFLLFFVYRDPSGKKIVPFLLLKCFWPYFCCHRGSCSFELTIYFEVCRQRVFIKANFLKTMEHCLLFLIAIFKFSFYFSYVNKKTSTNQTF